MMGLARWMSWNAWETDKLRRRQEYRDEWDRGQAALVAALLRGQLTINAAAARLATLPAGLATTAWYAAQLEFMAALRERRTTLKAAALKLGVATADELERLGTG